MTRDPLRPPTTRVRSAISQAVGKLDRVNGRLAFAEFTLSAHLKIAAEGDQDLARKLLEKAEGGCLVSASLACPVKLTEKDVSW